MLLPLMGSSDKNRGRDFLEHRSRLIKSIRALGPIGRVLIVEDRTSDADMISGALHRIFGYDLPIAFARSEPELVEALRLQQPDLIFLDDRLDRRTNAETTVPMIRRAGYAGPIVIVAAIMTRERSLELARLSVGDIVHKDDMTSTRLGEAILRVLAKRTPPGSAQPSN